LMPTESIQTVVGTRDKGVQQTERQRDRQREMLPRKPPVPRAPKIKRKKRTRRVRPSAEERRHHTLDTPLPVVPSLSLAGLSLSSSASSPRGGSGAAAAAAPLRTARGPIPKRNISASIFIIPQGTSAWRVRAVFSLLRRELGAARVAVHPAESLPGHTPLERDLVLHGLGGLPCLEELAHLLQLPERERETGVRAILTKHFDATPRVWRARSPSPSPPATPEAPVPPSAAPTRRHVRPESAPSSPVSAPDA
jgi:hypothetical protein